MSASENLCQKKSITFENLVAFPRLIFMASSVKGAATDILQEVTSLGV